ncbi:MRP-S28 domain-containing protein [Mycena chlorophos]|uniref:MRP-S28 domain-containing protein n=1 Tax=Mycena chlorophos TaxID=658473 RepID=A0A8H6T4R7_MYCCL|nr:MRP-S28 domain-containing protein [Mycena chlorophos]
MAAPRRGLVNLAATEEDWNEDFYLDMLSTPYEDDDTVAAGHIMLQNHRQLLYYLRLIEHEMPKLVAYRRPFVPPPDASLVVRSINYGGEEHPATAKRVVVAAVDSLPLKDADAIHRIKILSGPRWTPQPPADAGVSQLDEWKNGYIKISCEDFPEPAMNLKWASDTMDRLIEHANNPKHNLKDVPIDLRHVYAKARKAKKGEHTR